MSITGGEGRKAISCGSKCGICQDTTEKLVCPQCAQAPARRTADQIAEVSSINNAMKYEIAGKISRKARIHELRWRVSEHDARVREARVRSARTERTVRELREKNESLEIEIKRRTEALNRMKERVSAWESEQRDARVLAQETLDVALGVNRVAIEQTLPPVIAGLRAAICAHLRQPRAGILRLRRPTPRHRDLVPTVLGAAPIPLSPLDLVSGGDEWGAQQAAAALEGAATLARLLALFCACPALADLHGTAHNASASLPSSFLSLLSSAPDSTPSSCHLPVTWLAGTTTAAQDLVQAVAGVSRATSPAGASPEVALARLSQGLRALFVHFRTVALAALPQSLVGSQAWASAQDLPPPVLLVRVAKMLSDATLCPERLAAAEMGASIWASSKDGPGSMWAPNAGSLAASVLPSFGTPASRGRSRLGEGRAGGRADTSQEERARVARVLAALDSGGWADRAWVLNGDALAEDPLADEALADGFVLVDVGGSSSGTGAGRASMGAAATEGGGEEGEGEREEHDRVGVEGREGHVDRRAPLLAGTVGAGQQVGALGVGSAVGIRGGVAMGRRASGTALGGGEVRAWQRQRAASELEAGDGVRAAGWGRVGSGMGALGPQLGRRGAQVGRAIARLSSQVGAALRDKVGRGAGGGGEGGAGNGAG